MPRRTSYWVAAVWVGAVAAAGAPALAQTGEPLERIEFALGDQRYRIAMPKGSKLSDAKARRCALIWHPHAIRLMKFLELCSPPVPAGTAHKSATTLGNGGRLRYNIDHDIGGGSGGTEGELTGHLELEGRVLSLTCRDQSERKTAPGWCLRYLDSFSFVAGK